MYPEFLNIKKKEIVLLVVLIHDVSQVNHFTQMSAFRNNKDNK